MATLKVEFATGEIKKVLTINDKEFKQENISDGMCMRGNDLTSLVEKEYPDLNEVMREALDTISDGDGDEDEILEALESLEIYLED